MLNTYFKIGDFVCYVDHYDRETGLWGYCCDEVPVLNGWTCEKWRYDVKSIEGLINPSTLDWGRVSGQYRLPPP